MLKSYNIPRSRLFPNIAHGVTRVLVVLQKINSELIDTWREYKNASISDLSAGDDAIC